MKYLWWNSDNLAGVQISVRLYGSERENLLQMKPLAKLLFVCLLAWAPHASAQQTAGRFYPEKHEYLVGEPVVIVFEVLNSSAQTVEIAENNCPSLNPDQFEVDNAPLRRTVELYGCGEKGSAGSCAGSWREIPAGGEYRQRFLLEGAFELDSPGNFHVRAKREQTIYSKEKNDLGVHLKVASEFDVNLRAANPGELEAAYQPFLDDLHTRDIMVRSFAASAVTQNPPSFAETAILALANDPLISTRSIQGLKRLATLAARVKLLEMASTAFPEYSRQPAIEALGEIGNPEDCQAMLAIAGENKNYTQAEAYIMAGRICKETALPALNGLLASGGSQLLMGVAGGLANTSSRAAVTPLIGLLSNSDRTTRRAAANALATLTRRTSKYGVGDEDSAKQSYTEWSNWWSINGRTAPIYNSDQCTALQSLP